MSVKRRARTDEQKHNRRQMILDAAWAAYQQQPYTDITIAEIAKTVGLAKGTMYLYFQTKEELFLAVAEMQLDAWFVVIGGQLATMHGTNDMAGVAALLCGTLDERRGLLGLFTILHTVIERNISQESALRFKRFLLDRMSACSQTLESALPSLPTGSGLRFYLWAYAEIIGLTQLTDPAPIITAVIAAEAELAPFDLDFCEECNAVMTTLLNGLSSH
jgi:AcrR family transcriptional regulator